MEQIVEMMGSLELRLRRSEESRASLEEQLASMGSDRRQREHATTSVVDTKLLGKPPSFDGAPEKWRDWSLVFKAYMGAVDERYGDAFRMIETAVEPVLNDRIDERWTGLSSQMYFILVMLVLGSALDKVHNAGSMQGFEGWRQLMLTYEPRLRTRYVGLLLKILSFRLGEDIAAGLSSFERLVREYETQSGKIVDSDLKIGVILLHLPDGHLRDHLMSNVTRMDTWEKAREEIMEIARTREYLRSNADSSDALCAMGKGKGMKGKSKGKGCAKGKGAKPNLPEKGKGKTQKSKGKGNSGATGNVPTCFHCKRDGHVKKDCPELARAKAKAEANAAPRSGIVAGAALTIADQLDEAEEGAPYLFALPYMTDDSDDDRCQTLMLHAFTRRPREHWFMIDNCAGGSVFPRGYDKDARDEVSRSPISMQTATGQVVRTGAGKRSIYALPNGRGLVVRYREGEVTEPIISVSEMTEEGNWLVIGPGVQFVTRDSVTMLDVASRIQQVRLEHRRGAYWMRCLDVEYDNDETDLQKLCPIRAAATVDTAPCVEESSGDGHYRLGSNAVRITTSGSTSASS